MVEMVGACGKNEKLPMPKNGIGKEAGGRKEDRTSEEKWYEYVEGDWSCLLYTSRCV